MPPLLPISRLIADLERNLPITLLTLPAEAPPISAEILARNDTGKTGAIGVRVSAGKPSESDWLIQGFTLPRGRFWRRPAEILSGGMTVEVKASIPGISFRVSGI